MRCPHCQHDNAQGAAYCNHCGSRLQLRCESCHAQNTADSKFCRQCGASLAAENTPGGSTRRQHEGQAGPSVSIAICPRCRKTNEPGAGYCFSCGLPLESSQETSVEQPAKSAEPAGFWIRFVAYFVDVFVIVLVGSIFLGGYSEDLASSDWGTELLVELEPRRLFLNALYFTVLIAVWRTTIGKRLFRVYVVRPDGSRVGPGRALARYLFYYISGLVFFLGFIMIGLRQDKRGLHDLICDTRVLRRQR